MKIPLELLKVEDPIRDGYQILCRIHIKNKEYRMLVDTGASMTLFDIKKSKEISENLPEKNNNNLIAVGSNNIDSQTVIIEEFRIGDIIIKDYKMLLISLDNLNSVAIKKGNPLIHGILGGDILNKYKVYIDYRNLEIILH